MRLQEREIRFWYWLVKLLPNKLLYFCYCRVLALATTGIYWDTEVPKVTAMEVLERYALQTWPPKTSEADKL